MDQGDRVTFQTPCARPENNPDDWFISRDGKQDPEESIPGASEEDIQKALDSEEERLGRPLDEREAGKIAGRLYNDAQRAQLQLRRHAKDKCYTDCILRTQCLDVALQSGERHGTWGGYYEEELREIRRGISRRERRQRRTA